MTLSDPHTHVNCRRACWFYLSSVALRLWVTHRNIARFCMFHMLNTVAARSVFCLVRSCAVCWIIIVTLVAVSDRAPFLQTGYVKSQKNRFWLWENSTLIYELPLHDTVIGVWCALCQDEIVEPVLYSHRYVTLWHRLVLISSRFPENPCLFSASHSPFHTANSFMPCLPFGAGILHLNF